MSHAIEDFYDSKKERNIWDNKNSEAEYHSSQTLIVKIY
jgi:hypothetical protein